MRGVDDSLRVRGALVTASAFLAVAGVAMFVFAGVVAGWTAAGDALVDVPCVEAALGDPSEAVSYGNLENVTTDTAAATDTDTVREGATR